MINTAALFKRLSHCLRLTRYTTVSFLVWSPEQVDKWREVGVFVTGAVGGPHCDSSFLDFYPPPVSHSLTCLVVSYNTRGFHENDCRPFAKAL